MYSPIYDNSRLEEMQKVGLALRKINAAPILFNDEDADAFIEGLKAMNRLSVDEYKRLNKLSVKEMIEGWGGDKSAQIKMAVATMAKALQATNDSLFSVGKMNESLQVAQRHEKSFHAAGNTDLGKAVLELAGFNTAYSRPEIDAGWLGLFTMVDARGRESVKVEDILGFIRFYELNKHEEVILTPVGDRNGTSVGYRLFGGGVMFDNYDMQNSLTSANQILAGIRAASTDIKAILAYRELCADQTLSYSAITKFSGTSGTRDGEWARVNNNIHTMNEAARQMLENALQRDGKKKVKTVEGILPVTPATPIVVLYNPKHAEEIDRMRRMTGGDDGTNSRLLYNFQFQPSYLVPNSGGLTYSPSSNRDEWGLFGTATESGSKGSMGVRFILPGMRNLMLMFKDLEFGQDIRFSSQSTVVSAFERMNCVVDDRQSAKVSLIA